MVKMERVIICGELNMPHGSPGANYIQHLAMAFRAIGKNVVIISNVETKDKKELEYIQNSGIKIQRFSLSKRKVIRSIDFNYLLPIKIQLAIENEKPTKEDLIIVYARRPDVLERVLAIGKKYGAKTAVCVVEWYGREDVQSEKELLQVDNVMNNCYTRFDVIIPISEMISEFFGERDCRTVYLPCMADETEYPFIRKKYFGKKKIVYPANGKMKDALLEMLNAIIDLPEMVIEQCEFHFCGVKESAAMELTHNRIDKLIKRNAIIFHKWMTYQQLIELYNEMHFLLLMRNKTRMTLSNFPSKVPETMMQGVTPVCTDVGDYTRLYLEHGVDAIIVPDAKCSTICMALNTIAEMSWEKIEKMNLASRETAERCFEYHRWLNAVKDIIEGDRQ